MKLQTRTISEGDWVICRGDRTSDWSGCGRGSRDVALPGESSGMGTGEGKTRTIVKLSSSTIFLKRKTLSCVSVSHLCSRNLDRHWRGGQQARSRGVDRRRRHRPQSTLEKKKRESGILKVGSVRSFHLGFPKLSPTYCISEARLLVGMFQLLLEGDSCSRNESYTQIWNSTPEWLAKTTGTTKVRRTYPAGMWSDCGQGSLAADGGGTAWPEMQMHLVDNKIQLGLLHPKNWPTEHKKPCKPIQTGVTFVLSTLISS